MKIALDTSVLVAAVVGEHPMHSRAVWWLRGAADLSLTASLHAYAETWAVLTAHPKQPRVTGDVARAVMSRLAQRVKFAAARATTYQAAVARCAQRGLRSGAVYDALHLVTAEAQSADVLLTFNEADFVRISEPGGPRIAAPPDPPGPL